jgi:hypothetical protein
MTNCIVFFVTRITEVVMPDQQMSRAAKSSSRRDDLAGGTPKSGYPRVVQKFSFFSKHSPGILRRVIAEEIADM